jgi:hypothetical protein
MDDLKTRLDHLSTRVEDRPDALVRLERRRRVRARTRRLTAGILAVGIAVAGTATAYSAFTTPNPPVPGVGSTGAPIAALWPEHDTEQLQATQEAVDAGDAALDWRLDAEDTAERFVRSVLGWTSPDERLHLNASEAPSGLVTVDAVTVPASCQEESCDVVHDVVLQLLRLGDEDGIWSVIAAESPVFNMQFRIGQAVRIGDDLEMISGHPSGVEIAVGVKVFEPCSGFHEGTVAVEDHRVSVSIVGIDEGCIGYVYALTPQGQGQSARDLFENRPGDTIDSIAVAPVFIVSSDGSGSVSDVPQPEEA